MMQFYFADLLLVGITKLNLEKLVDKRMPLYLDLHHPVRAVSVMYGVDKLDILQQIEEANPGGTSPYMWEAAKEDPS